MGPRRILIVDDNEILARSIARNFVAACPGPWAGGEPDATSVGVRAAPGADVTICPSFRQAQLRLRREAGFHIVLLDKVLPDGDGRSLISLARQASPEGSVFVLAGVLDADEQLSILAEGAVPLVKPLNHVARLLDYDYRRQVATERVVRLFAEIHRMSPAQSRVLEETARSAYTLEELATKLGISRATVATHWRHIFSRTGARNQLAVMSMLLAFVQQYTRVIQVDDGKRSALPR